MRRKRKSTNRRMTIFVVGGVMSGVGKGVVTASIGTLLKECGLKVTAVKIDPYVNVDAGTMNPIEHGEVFVTKDGAETDQDMGNYERFLEVDVPRVNYMTTGAVYQTVIERERSLGYGGKTVEVVPHIPLEVISRIRAAQEASDADVTMVEIGGTVGEYQNVLFLEAARMMKRDEPHNVLIVLVSYMPVPASLGEMKTKPTQYAVKLVNEVGLFPDLIVTRSTHVIDDVRKAKLGFNCGLKAEDIIAAPDVPSIYDVPSLFRKQHVPEIIINKLKIRGRCPIKSPWVEFSKKIHRKGKPVRIGIVGKYFSTGDFVLGDVYLCVIEALKHATWHLKATPEITWINSEEIEKKPKEISRILGKLDGILIPGGFGNRGVEGKIMAVKYAREHKVPYFGLCYGMQMATIEVARNILGWTDANTTEVDKQTKHPVIHLMNEQEERLRNTSYGGTMRLGEYPCILQSGSLARRLYGHEFVMERHRHRYEFNPVYRERLENAGLHCVGTSPDNNLVEIVEFKNHPFFLATQFHPEFLSRPFHPHPLFVGFIKAALNKKRA
ncbi:MAG: CTP synthase [Patescibacteria group bacterium]|nr:CTP synthase [Patescibacteria group bacterium]